MSKALILIIASLCLLEPSGAGAQTAGEDILYLHPGDAIRLEIWREEDLTGEFMVDEAGRVVLPLLGPRVVVGQPFDVIRDGLLEEFGEQLRNPSIRIVPLRRVSVLGEVRDPGLYAVDPTISLGDVVALAGGATSAGDLSRIRLVRDGHTIATGLRSSADMQAMDIRSGDQVVVERRSWFDRNSTFIVSALLSITGIIISLAR